MNNINSLKRTGNGSQTMPDGIHRRNSSIDRKTQTDWEVSSYIINAIENLCQTATEHKLTLEIS